MLENIPTLKSDPLWGLLHDFNADTREEKIDLLVGVYRDETGETPVMQEVKDAELKLASQAASKSYRMLSGNTKFNDQIAEFVLGDSHRIEDQYTIQTVGGSGALRVLADFIAAISPSSTIWVTDPGYINHRPLMEGAGLKVETFSWQSTNGQLDIECCFEDLSQMVEGDVLLLHACCHNPTGIDPSLSQWQQFIDFCQYKKVIPFIDMAYQGFGDTPDIDAQGLRLLVDQIDEVFIATSCSKNMGLYCERVGAATVLTSNKEYRDNIRPLLEIITRANYSMPPNHGSAIASMLLENPDSWLNELSQCRDRVVNIREALGSALRRANAPVSLHMLSQYKGMFSILPLSDVQMSVLREKYAIYGMPNGRINIAGLRLDQVERLSQALVDVLDT